jgi:uncharacterized protein with HEPN domain
MRRDAAAIVDMLESARAIQDFTARLDEAGFMESRLVRAAVLYQLTVIGEAVRRVSPSTRLAHPEVPWLGISNMRNVLVHDYDDVRLPRVWMIVTRQVPLLIAALDPIVQSLFAQPPDETPE